MELNRYVFDGDDVEDDINLEVQPDNPQQNQAENHHYVDEINFEVSDVTEADEVIEANEEQLEPHLNQAPGLLENQAENHYGEIQERQYILGLYLDIIESLFKRIIILSVIFLLIILSMHLSELTQENLELHKQLDKSKQLNAHLKQKHADKELQFTAIHTQCSAQNDLLYAMQQICMQEKEVIKQKSVKEHKILEQTKDEQHTIELKTFERKFVEQSEELSRTKQKNTKLNQENSILKQLLAKEEQRNIRAEQKFKTLSHHCEEQHKALNRATDQNKELNLIIAMFKEGLTSDYTRNEDLVQKLEKFQNTCRVSKLEQSSMQYFSNTLCEQLSSYLELFKSSQRLSANYFELIPWT